MILDMLPNKCNSSPPSTTTTEYQYYENMFQVSEITTGASTYLKNIASLNILGH